MPSLVIVESPAKAKTIANFLGRKYIVEASYGHVRDLPAGRKEVPDEYKSEKWAEFGVNIEGDFEPIYIIQDEKKKRIAALRSALKESDELLLATDEDREGESISWHLLEVLKPKVPVRRIVFHEITREAIRKAIENPREVDTDLVRAQECRRIVDRLFGYKLSPVLWRKVQPGLSAGRVQSVAVRLLVEREEERRAFVSAEYWDVEAEVGHKAGTFKATLSSVGGKRLATGKDFEPTTGRLTAPEKVLLLNAAQASELLQRLQGALPWTVKSVEEKPAPQRPYPPFTTSTLQQEANRKLGFSAKKTMQIAQKLYEGVDLGGDERVGLITYMRTDSVTLSDKALQDAQAVIRSFFGDEYATGPKRYTTKTRNAQEAHEAIRPTELSRKPESLRGALDRDELALYDLIWKRTLASQMPDARLLRTAVEIAANSPRGEAIFSASGKKILFPGFLRAYVEGSDDPNADLGDQEVVLPDLQVGQKVQARRGDGPLHLEAILPKQHNTSPPARYTEASLVKKLEEEGIGRPSTYASILSTIQERGYVEVNKSRQLVPTFTAMAVTDLLRRHFGEYVDLQFTARMEEELDQVAAGQRPWLDHVRVFFRGDKARVGLESLVESKQKTIDFPVIELGKENGLPIRVRIGKFGPYLIRGEGEGATLADVPAGIAPADLTLDEARRLLDNKKDGPRVLGKDPATGLDVYAMEGRFGAYVQLGETPDDKKAPKPRRASLDKGQSVASLTLEQALALLSFPRNLGPHPSLGADILVFKGKFGPYVACGEESRSLRGDDTPLTVTRERALELLAEPRQPRARAVAQRTVLRDLGKTADGASLTVLDGRYGAYVTDGTTNASLPKGKAVEELTVAEALELLAARGGASSAKGKKGAARKAPAKGAAGKASAAPKKAEKAAAPRAAAKKAAAPKASKKAKS